MIRGILSTVALAALLACGSATPHQLVSLSGTGPQQSVSFDAPDQWFLSYSFDCGGLSTLFQIYTFRNGLLSGAPANVTAASGKEDRIVQHGSGSTYLAVSVLGVAQCSWTVSASS